jgi:hypothetical protein
VTILVILPLLKRRKTLLGAWATPVTTKESCGMGSSFESIEIGFRRMVAREQLLYDVLIPSPNTREERGIL